MDKPALTRRNFLGSAALTSAAAALIPPDHLLSALARKHHILTGKAPAQVIAGRCYECHVQCGMLVHVREGPVVGVEGNPGAPNRGALCAKGHATVANLYSPERLNYPMKRTRPKGDPDPGWVRISWDEALNTIVSRLSEIRDRYGPHAIAVGQGTGRFSEELNLRLKNSLGTPNFLGPSHICRGPMAATTCLTIGHHVHAECHRTGCRVYWGKNAPWSHAAWTAHGQSI